MNLDQYLATLRNEVMLANAKAQETSLAALDRVSQQVKQLSLSIKSRDDEITRLKALCEKHKIDTTPPKQEQPSQEKKPDS